jgi:soluble lytic murein transglycosylase-like protein
MEKLSIRLAKTRRKLEQHRLYRLLGGRGAVTLALGAALSIGGITEAIDGVHFVVEKDLDAVRVVRQGGSKDVLVAKVDDGFAANTLFKLAQVLPDSFVSRERELFSEAWLPEPVEEQQASQQPKKKRDVFHEEMARINEAIREQFFANAMPFGDLIHEKAKKYDVDPILVAAVIEQESKFRSRARSQVGAKGLMQLMPRTGRWMGARNLYDPEQNVDAGVKYIKYLSEKYDGNLKKTIAAYNAGEGNVKRYNGVPPFRETQTYVKKVLKNYEKRNNELRAYNAAGLREAETAPEPGALTIR